MKHFLSIITIIIVFGCFLSYNKEEILYQKNPPIHHHIETVKKTKTFSIKKEKVIEQKNQQLSKYKQSNSSIDIPKKEPTKPIKQESQYPQHLTSEQLSIIKVSLVNSINQTRSSPVSVYSPLLKSANLRAKEANQKWSHTRPNGLRWNTTLKDIINIQSVAHGENLAQYSLPYKESYSQQELIRVSESIHQALMNSPTHYKVMTNTNYKKVNIGIYTTLADNIIKITVAQHFIA